MTARSFVPSELDNVLLASMVRRQSDCRCSSSKYRISGSALGLLPSSYTIAFYTYSSTLWSKSCIVRGKLMPLKAMGLSAVKLWRAVTPSDVFKSRYEFIVNWITATITLAKVVQLWLMPTQLCLWQRPNQPSKKQPMDQHVLALPLNLAIPIYCMRSPKPTRGATEHNSGIDFDFSKDAGEVFTRNVGNCKLRSRHWSEMSFQAVARAGLTVTAVSQPA